MKLKYLFLISIAFTSCSDFLDVKPIGKLIPTEIEEFENLLNNESTIKYHSWITTIPLFILCWRTIYP